jgi:hypothetical protein
MKKSLFILILTALAATSFASKVTNVELTYLNGEAVARIDVSGPIRFTHQTEIPKDGKPDRVIVDILSAIHELGGKIFEHVPVCPVTAVRTSQYAVTPESVVRVVFDMKKTPVYQVETKGQSILIHFADKPTAPFPTWSTAQYLTPAPKPAVPVAVAPKADLPGSAASPATPAQKNTQAEHDRLVSLSNSTVSRPVATTQPTQPLVDKSAPSVAKPSTPATPAPTVAAIPKAESKPVESKLSTPVTTIDTKPSASVTSSSAQPTAPAVPAKPTTAPATPATASSPSQAAPLVAAVPKSEIKPAVPATQNSSAPNMATAPAKPTTAPATPTTESSPSGVKSVTPAIPPTATPTSSTATGKPATPAPTPEPKPVPAPGPSTTPAVTNSPVLPAPVAPTTGTPRTSPAPVNASSVAPTSNTPNVPTQVTVKPTDKSSPVPAQVTPTEKAAATDKSVVVTGEKPYTASDEVIPEPEDMEPAEDNPYVDHDTPAGAEWADEPATDSNSTARFRRHPVSASKIKGTMIAQFPQRLVIKYESNGMRDPFETLINDTKTFNTPTQQGIPNVDGLRLVGVIISRQGGNRALLQDKGGLSYMLESGDKVRNGYVLRIETDRVYFQVFEYGWSRTIALKIAES